MTPADVVDLVKEDARIGTVGNYTDKAALSLLTRLSLRLFEIWRFHDWEWQLDPVSLTVSSTDYEKTFPATTGELYEMQVSGQSGYLPRYSRRQYLQWLKYPDPATTGSLRGYIHLGRDASMNLKVRFFDPPSTSSTVIGWSKKRFVKLTTADWATEIAYFPEEMQDIICKFLRSDAYRMANDNRSYPELQVAQRDLVALKGEEDSQADLEPKAPPPDYIRFVRRRRGSGTGVA